MVMVDDLSSAAVFMSGYISDRYGCPVQWQLQNLLGAAFTGTISAQSRVLAAK
jgi:hypothetical protein